MRSTLPLAVAIVAAAVQAQMPTCSGSGLTVAGGRLGDAFSLEIAGPPGAAGVLAADIAGGPVMTPYGSICLGLTPALTVSPCTLDANGRFALSGVLPLASSFPVGSTQFLQAALAHPTLPGGFMLTNGVAATIRSPRLALFHFSCWTCGQPTSLDLLDPVTDTVAATVPSLPWNGGKVVHLKREGWFGWKVGIPSALPPGSVLPPNLPPNGTFVCVDDQSGATVLTIPNVWSMAGDEWAVSEDGNYLTVILTGMAPVYDRFWVKSYALPSGNLLSVQAVPSSGYAPHGIFHIPGTSIAYLASTDKIHVFDVAAGNEIATIMLPGNLSNPPYSSNGPGAFLSQGILYCIAGNSLVGIDTSSHMIVAQGPTVSGAMLAHGLGPGSAGPAIWASTATGSSYQLVEIPLSTLTPIAVAPLSVRPSHATPSAGGTEMIFDLYPPAMVMVVNGATHASVSFPGLVAATALRSDTLTKAYAISTGNPSGQALLVSFPTDPCTGASSLVAAPLGVTLLSN
jgi:hypothetical protein